MEYKNTHESIKAHKDGAATDKQVNYLIALYKDAIKQSITKSMTKLDKSNDYINFGMRAGALRGKFAIHAYNTFIPQNREYTKNKVSELIHNAKESQKFDKTFTRSLVKSCNDYAKAQAS
jgi:hypothetical protein